jgi:hypothetical protein
LGGHDQAGSKSKEGPFEGFEGDLQVSLIKAKNLIKADLTGKSDPYGVLKFGKQSDKTNVIKNTQDPQWDFDTSFKVPDGDAEKLLVEVFDSDKLGKDKSLGTVEVDVLDLAGSDGQWIPLKGVKSGEVLLRADLIPEGEDASALAANNACVKGTFIRGLLGFFPVFRSRIRPDPKLFGFKDLDPKLIITDPSPDPNPPLYHTKLRNMF